MTHDKNTRFRKAYRPAADNRAPVDKVLAALDKVKSTGPGKWLALCPAHDDKRPSLSVRETEDHRVLLKCWAGCGAAEIVNALRLSLADLFPGDRRSLTEHGTGPLRKPFDYRDALTGISTEAITVRFIAGALARGETLDDSAVNRLAVAEQRISDALSAAGGAKC
ncbi:hypothetical protein GL267_010185 [Acidithiobacillus ferrianus]|uniref:Virulence-associated protein E n=2 Tax=Acidithiobacillus ferrianus TaxID=2678518 RepID=A0A845UA12_9PROT|nr:hypothetical protein [Acidithiobacillus ferrianus]NDU42597.1 hypothetical protein [Acidithiobacillus ferrianus]